MKPFLVILLLVTIYAQPVIAQCDPETLSEREASIAALTNDIGTLDRQIASLRDQLADLGRKIDRARSGSGGASQRRLKRLLQDSRSLSSRLDDTTSARRRLAERRAPLVTQLGECYEQALNAATGELVRVLDLGRYAQGPPLIKRIGDLEVKTRYLETLRETRADSLYYPRVSEEFLRNVVTSVEQRTLVLESMRDLAQAAVHDSARLSRRLEEVRDKLQLKRDLLSVMRRSVDTGLGNTGFFTEFSDDEVKEDIRELNAEQQTLGRGLTKATLAIAYYREHITLLERLAN